MAHDPLIAQAQKIALRDLRQCYERDGIVAGQHHFTDYWARDGYFAASGAFAIGDHKIVEKMVALFLSHQRPDGLIPYRVMRGPISLGKYLGKPAYYKIPQPTYRLRGIGPVVLDGTTLTVLWCAKLGLAGWSKARAAIPQLRKALAFLETREKHGLLWDGVMAEWQDSIWKWGNLLYSNVIYWKMLDELARYLQKIKDPTWKTVKAKQKRVAQALRDRLWNGAFFADWYDYKRQDYCNAFGNCLAIAWGLTSPEETESILAVAKQATIGFTLETNTPKYPWWRIDFLNHLTGTGDYQNKGLLWWQQSASYAEALVTAGHQDEAQKHIFKMAEKILADGIVECYERTGRPVKRLLYQAESPFAWSAGMLVHAFQQLELILQ